MPPQQLSASTQLFSVADVAALDSAIAAAGIERTTRRTDVKLGPQTLRIHRVKKPEPLLPVDHAVERLLAIAHMRDARLMALWASGAITDDEYFALRVAA